MDEAAARHRRLPLIVLGTAVVAIGLDQLAKTWAEHALASHDLQSGFGPRLTLTYNSGAAFSVGAGRSTVFTLLASVTVLCLIGYSTRARLDPVRAAAFGLIIGGAGGNLVDRLARDNGGRVIDFIEAARWWPVFNVADAALFVGVVLMLLASWRHDR